MMRAAEIIAAAPDLPGEIQDAIRDLDRRAYGNGQLKLTALEVTSRIRPLIAECGSEAALARRWGISKSYLNDVMSGRRDPGDSILRHLGLRRIPAGRVQFTAAD